MQTHVGKWGNSLAVRIPAAFAREAGLEEGAAVDLAVSEGQLIVTRARSRYNLEDLISAITPENRHPETDWGEPAGNEAW